MCGPAFNCAASTSQNCQSVIERYEEQTRRGLEPLEKANDEDDHQTLKHIVLLIILLCSMFVVSCLAPDTCVPTNFNSFN